jgi:hypothetical protein
MSVHALVWAFQQDLLAPIDKWVLVCLANYADPMGDTGPVNLVALARVAALSVDEVQTSIGRLLNDLGIIAVAEISDTKENIYVKLRLKP